MSDQHWLKDFYDAYCDREDIRFVFNWREGFKNMNIPAEYAECCDRRFEYNPMLTTDSPPSIDFETFKRILAKHRSKRLYRKNITSNESTYSSIYGVG